MISDIGRYSVMAVLFPALRKLSRWLHAKPTLSRKVVHLFGLLFLVPLMTWDRWPNVLLISAIVGVLWITLRFLPQGLLGVTILILTGGPKIAGVAWTCFIVGDGLAGMVGMRWGIRHLPWNPSKTILGTTAFLVGAWPCLILYFRYAYGAHVWLSTPLAFFVSSCGALAESIQQTTNDNFTVVIACGVSCSFAMAVSRSLTSWPQ